MTEATVTRRTDPYKNFNFKVKWDGAYVAGMIKVSTLRRTTQVVEHREGGSPNVVRKSPGATLFDAITLERELTHDTAFEDWANQVLKAGSPATSTGDFRKDIVIDCFNEAGQKVLSYKIYRCWVSEYRALPDLDTNATAIAVEHIRLECEGWERDLSVVQPIVPL